MADSEHNVTININGNANVAVRAINGVKTALLSARSAVNGFLKAFGVFGMGIQGVQLLFRGFSWLKDKITETARELAKFRWDLEMRNAANETARLVGWHEKLAKLMKDELDTLNKQRSVQSIEEQGQKDYEDGKREADRARQIFEAKSPEEEQALRDRFAAEDEQRGREERKAQRKQKIDNLDREESVYSSKARSLRDNNSDIDRQLENERHNLLRANGKEDVAEPIKKRIEALEQRKKANEAEIALFDKEAKFRRDQIAALEKQQDYGGPTAGEWQRKTEAKKRAEEKAKEESDAKEQADKQAARETARAEAQRISAKNSARLEESRGLDAFAGRLAAQDGVSTNRLSAMGLGSGVRGGSGVASDVKRLVKLLEDEVAATKDIDTSSTWGE